MTITPTETSMITIIKTDFHRIQHSLEALGCAQSSPCHVIEKKCKTQGDVSECREGIDFNCIQDLLGCLIPPAVPGEED